MKTKKPVKDSKYTLRITKQDLELSKVVEGYFTIRLTDFLRSAIQTYNKINLRLATMLDHVKYCNYCKKDKQLDEILLISLFDGDVETLKSYCKKCHDFIVVKRKDLTEEEMAIQTTRNQDKELWDDDPSMKGHWFYFKPLMQFSKVGKYEGFIKDLMEYDKYNNIKQISKGSIKLCGL